MREREDLLQSIFDHVPSPSCYRTDVFRGSSPILRLELVASKLLQGTSDSFDKQGGVDSLENCIHRN